MKILEWFFPKLTVAQAPEPEPLSPHEIFPEILHWKQGDRIEMRDRGFTWRFHSLHPDGTVYLKLFEDFERWGIKTIERKATNLSLRNREIQLELQETVEYQQLLQEFQNAVQALKDRDKRNGIDY